MYAIKRDGVTREKIDPEKINQWLEWACEGTDVPWSELAHHIHIQFYDGITTADIHKITVKAAADLISEEEPDYQVVAGKLVQAGLRKQVYGRFEPTPFLDHIHHLQSRGVYDTDPTYSLTAMYTEFELIELGEYVDHERDFLMTYAGAQQFIDKYLVQDRSTGEIFETPQYAFMACLATLLGPSLDIMTREERTQQVFAAYDDYTLHKCSQPTPILAGMRTSLRRYASCCLFEFGDSIESIDAAESVGFKMTASRSGLGIYIGGMRAELSRIRGGEVSHTGLVPFLRRMEATTESCTQNGVRGGGGTVNYPLWHRDFQDLVVLKNTEGGEESRIQGLDHCFHYDGYLLGRYLKQRQIDADPFHPDKNKPRQVISFFSPYDVPGLEMAFTSPHRERFIELYEKYENDQRIQRKTLDAIEVFSKLWTERIKTGRVYCGHIDHMNTHSSFNVNVKMTNLCTEITLPTEEVPHALDLYGVDSDPGRPDAGEIALCILGGIAWGFCTQEELPGLTFRQCLMLDNLIEIQEYPFAPAERNARNRRNIGIGPMNVAYMLASNKVPYESREAATLVHEWAESMQFHLLKASSKLAKLRGNCKWFHETKYAEGLLPIDHYKKDVDELHDAELRHDWEGLRREIAEYGLRFSTHTAGMPGESSSVVINATNAYEPPLGPVGSKTSRRRTLPFVVPGLKEFGQYYTWAYDMKNNDGYRAIVAVMQKFFDQSLSYNQYYDYTRFPDGKLEFDLVAMDMMKDYKYGIKTHYYLNTNVHQDDASLEGRSLDDQACDSGACGI